MQAVRPGTPARASPAATRGTGRRWAATASGKRRTAWEPWASSTVSPVRASPRGPTANSTSPGRAVPRVSTRPVGPGLPHRVTLMPTMGPLSRSPPTSGRSKGAVASAMPAKTASQ